MGAFSGGWIKYCVTISVCWFLAGCSDGELHPRTDTGLPDDDGADVILDVLDSMFYDAHSTENEDIIELDVDTSDAQHGDALERPDSELDDAGGEDSSSSSSPTTPQPGGDPVPGGVNKTSSVPGQEVQFLTTSHRVGGSGGAYHYYELVLPSTSYVGSTGIAPRGSSTAMLNAWFSRVPGGPSISAQCLSRNDRNVVFDFAINMPSVNPDEYCSFDNKNGDLYLNISDGKPVGIHGVDVTHGGSCTQPSGCGYILDNRGFEPK